MSEKARIQQSNQRKTKDPASHARQLAEITMKNLLCPLFLGALLAAGCATPKPELSVQNPKAELSGLKTFYVSRDDEAKPQDEHHSQTLGAVQVALTGHGLPATSGLLSAMPADTGCKVMIHDHWFWDLQWYLLSLDMKFYDAHSGQLLASGFCRRAAPAIRRSPEFMANELVEAILSTCGGTTNH